LQIESRHMTAVMGEGLKPLNLRKKVRNIISVPTPKLREKKSALYGTNWNQVGSSY